MDRERSSSRGSRRHGTAQQQTKPSQSEKPVYQHETTRRTITEWRQKEESQRAKEPLANSVCASVLFSTRFYFHFFFSFLPQFLPA